MFNDYSRRNEGSRALGVEKQTVDIQIDSDPKNTQ
jgi:hypothetical protein